MDVVSALPLHENIEVIELGDKILMPGVIDPHVHINEPGRTAWEGFETATMAALAGGITTMIDMPLNSSPVTTSAVAFDEKVLASKNKLHTNVGLWGGVVPGNENEIEPLIKKGVMGFKAFLTHSGIDEFPNATEEDLCMAMPIIAKYNLPLLVHCELISNEQQAIGNEQPAISNEQPATSNEQQAIGNEQPAISNEQPETSNQQPATSNEEQETRNEHPVSSIQHPVSSNNSYQNYLNSRPKKWEDDAIAMMIRLCEKFNCRVHIVHLSSADSLQQIAAAKQKGLPITVETGQHYLYFNAEEIEDGRTEFKCAPPIREKENNDQLWQALQEGLIDFVATDHSPATPSLKEIESGDFMKAWGGIASIQFALPVLWTAAKKRNATFNDIAKWLCENPAKLINKENSKGKIAAGFDADLIVLDDEKIFTVTKEIILHKHKVTPYINEQLYGVVEQVYLAGEKVFADGKMNQPNSGKILLANR